MSFNKLTYTTGINYKFTVLLNEDVENAQIINNYNQYSLLDIKLHTGRTHQIRAHMASIGHPILGDVVYGHKKPELGQSSQVLHAGQLCFRHPRDQRPVMVMAPLPEYFTAVLEKLERML